MGNVNVFKALLTLNQANKLFALNNSGVQDGCLVVNAVDEVGQIVVGDRGSGKGQTLKGTESKNVACGLHIDNLQGDLIN